MYQRDNKGVVNMFHRCCKIFIRINHHHNADRMIDRQMDKCGSSEKNQNTFLLRRWMVESESRGFSASTDCDGAKEFGMTFHTIHFTISESTNI